MSQAAGQVNSTPNKNRTSARSQAGNQQYLRDDIKDDLELDLTNATKCNVDSILKYFVYLILDENNDDKKQLDQIQDKIEKLQEKRYYKTENNGTDQSGPDGTRGSAAKTYEQARREAANDDTTCSEEEKDLVQQREGILDKLFEEMLQGILPVANDKETKNLLKKFGNEFTKEEKSRYAPYVSLCNHLLHLLKDVIPEQVRGADPIDIRFHRNDPRVVYSSFFGMKNKLERVPDVIITSLFAARRAANKKKHADKFTELPDIRFDWEAILLNNEFKVKDGKKEKPDGYKLVEKAGFKFETSPGTKIQHLELVTQDLDDVDADEELEQDPDVVDADEPSDAQDSASSKRILDGEDEPDSLHVAKKRRGENSALPIPSGSKDNSATNSTSDSKSQSQTRPQTRLQTKLQTTSQTKLKTTSQARPQARSLTKPKTTSQTKPKATSQTQPKTASQSKPKTESQNKPKTESKAKKAVSGRVQCASYAMEMLSYSAGVHHAINILFTGEHLWIWYYDRQGIIQSDGMSIFSDFPRFVLLLFALQRFNLENWGIISSLNPKALIAHGRARKKPEDTQEEAEEESEESEEESEEREEGSEESEEESEETQEESEEDLFDPNRSSQQGKKRKADKGKAKATNDSLPPIVSSPPVVLPLTGNLEHLWVDDTKLLTKVKLDMDDFLSHQPHCLAGRATAVVSATGLTEAFGEIPMVCKIYHPEVQRRHEGLTLQVIHKIAEENDPGMSRHLPTMYFHADIPNTTTQRIRSMLKRNWKGHRVARILGLKKLDKITTVDGGQFVKAWLEVVTCHLFLWTNYVEHGDPSVNNMMYDSDAKCGVLTDFDLSLLQWEPRVFGTDRTGTIPFMAIDLLTAEYWEGRIRRFYHHELESFIWILPYVFLLYDAGIRKANPFVDAWRTSDYETCSEKKGHFLNKSIGQAESSVQPAFKDYWRFADELCFVLRLAHVSQTARQRANRPLLTAPSISNGSSSSGPSLSSLDSKELWDSIRKKLQDLCQDDALRAVVASLENHQPSFEEPNAEQCEELRSKFRLILQGNSGTDTDTNA